MHAGLDWTGTPSLNEPHPYGPCLVAVGDKTSFDEAWSFLAQEAGVERGEEIKGHKSPPRVLENVLRLVIASEVCVGVLLLDKSEAFRIRAIWPLPANLRQQTALGLIEEMVQNHVLQSLVCDEDIRGKREQQQFRTAVLRCNAQLQTAKMKVGFRRSEKSSLIQCADVIAYVAARSLRENALTPELEKLWRYLKKQPQTYYRVIYKWEE